MKNQLFIGIICISLPRDNQWMILERFIIFHNANNQFYDDRCISHGSYQCHVSFIKSGWTNNFFVWITIYVQYVIKTSHDDLLLKDQNFDIFKGGMTATNLSLVKVTLKFWGRKIVWTVFPVTSCVCTYKCSTNITCAFDRAWRKWVGTQKENFKINNPRWNIMIRELN